LSDNSKPYFLTEDPRFPPCLVFFDEEAVKNEVESANRGVPVFDNVVFARVLAAGQKQADAKYEVWRRRADGTESFKPTSFRRFQKLFEEWREKRTSTDAGTPLEMWPALDRAMVETLRHLNIYSVQQLAALSDSYLQNIGMGARELRAKAQAFLAQGAGIADIQRMAAEIEELKRRLREAEIAAQETNSRTNGFDPPERRRRGRPRKVVIVDEPAKDEAFSDDSAEDRI